MRILPFGCAPVDPAQGRQGRRFALDDISDELDINATVLTLAWSPVTIPLVPPPDWPWDAYTLSAIATHLGRNWVYRMTPRVAVEQDTGPWTAINFLNWQKTELAVSPRGRHGATGENHGLYLRRVQRMLFNHEGRRAPTSITFVAGKNQITIFGDGTYVGSSSSEVPDGAAVPGARPRLTSDSPQWEKVLGRLYDGAHRLIA